MILLARLGHLNLLQRFGRTVWVPISVFKEVVDDAPDAPGADQVKLATWLQQKAPRADTARFDLDDGEAEVLALTMELPNAVAVLDDYRARKVAETLDIDHIGLLGLLVHAKKHHLVGSIRPLVEKLVRHGWWIDERLVQKSLSEVGE